MTLEELLSELEIEYKRHGEHHHTSSGWLSVDCPFCSPEAKRFRLGINESSFGCSCWTCGRQSLTECLTLLAKRPRKAVQSLLDSLEDRPATRIEKISGSLKIPAGVGELKEAHIKYLLARGFPDTAQLVDRWRIGGIALDKRLAWRLFIPVHQQDRMVSWTTRSISSKASLRYINADPEEEAVPIKSVLYGADHCTNCCVVVEGPFDVWKIGPGAVCTFGTQYTQAQLLQISRFPVRVICFDSEPQAQKQAQKLIEELQPFPGKTYRAVLDAKDPGSASETELSELRKRFL